MKINLMYFETENSMKIVQKKVKEGKAKIGRKTWELHKTKPYFYETKSWFGLITKQSPIYIVTHKSSIPYKLEFESPSPGGTPQAKARYAVTPENYTELATQGAIGQLLKVKGQGMLDFMMWLIMGAIMGGLAGFVIAIMTPGLTSIVG